MKRSGRLIKIFAFQFILVLFLAGAGISWAADNVGVLVVAHGSTSEAWNQPVRDMVGEVCLPYPVELGFLEFVRGETIQDAVDRLEAQGADEILVSVLLFVSSHSSHIEEIKYLLGLPYDPEVVHADELPLPVESDAEFILSPAPALDDHPLVAQILCDRARRLSEDPDEEIVVITAHGAGTPEELAKWNENMESLTARMKWDLGVKAVRHSYVFEGREPYLRDVVEEAATQGRVIVIPLMISEGYFTGRKIPRVLEGLDYAYEGRALCPHPALAKWIELQARGALSGPLGKIPPISIYDADQGLLSIAFEDVIGSEVCPCGTSAFRACQKAFTQLRGQEIPAREDIHIISSHPSKGHSRMFEAITEAVSRGDYELDIPDGTGPENLTMDNYVYRFINRSDDTGIILRMKPEVFPARFLEFRNWIRPLIMNNTATPGQKKAFHSAKRYFMDSILTTDEPFQMAIPGLAACMGSADSGWQIAFRSYYRWEEAIPWGRLELFNPMAGKWFGTDSITTLLLSEDHAETAGKIEMNGIEYSFVCRAKGHHRGDLTLTLQGPGCVEHEMSGRVRFLMTKRCPVTYPVLEGLEEVTGDPLDLQAAPFIW